MSAPLREGAVQKWKGGEWKARHLELVAGGYLVYRAKKGKRELGRIKVRTAGHASENPDAFEVFDDEDGELSTFSAATKSDCEEWIVAIRSQLPQPEPQLPTEAGGPEVRAEQETTQTASVHSEPRDEDDAAGAQPAVSSEPSAVFIPSLAIQPAADRGGEESDEGAHHMSSTDSSDADGGTPRSRRVNFSAGTAPAREQQETQPEKKSTMKPVTPPASMLTAAGSWDTSAPTIHAGRPVPPLSMDFSTGDASTEDEEAEDMNGLDAIDEPADKPVRGPIAPVADRPASVAKPPLPKSRPAPSAGTGGSPAILGVLRMAQAKKKVEDAKWGEEESKTPPKPQTGGGLSLELMVGADDRVSAVEAQEREMPVQLLMTGTPRTPRGSIPYETELLREQLEQQLAMTAALREQLEASSADASMKQLRENWLLAEDRADQQRARLTDVCLHQVPGLKRDLAARNSENAVLMAQVAELVDELHEATSLGHELVLATPRQEDVNSVRGRWSV